MERNQLRRQVRLMRQSLFDQGFLDEQFVQLEELQDDANPNFVEEVATLYYRDSSRSLQILEQALQRNPRDFNKLDNYMQQFKGSSSSIGAKKVKADCQQFREYCNAGNAEGWQGKLGQSRHHVDPSNQESHQQPESSLD
ncbi:hypothetical protein DVH24_000274 [Malus domestica]|uniref:Histidine-containing phosphotransfer protein n=1 Tax=Malus domestica TaxID=3750 RepID=A0A498J1V8_MALDO|nr:hypothetical protein DVH24_000274 [Malus domestica]